jgi:outer membrane protein assembly factor BamA
MKLYRLTSVLSFIILLTTAFPSSAQQPVTATNSKQDSIKIKRNRIYAFPVLFYSPETRFGGGVAGIYAFRFRSDSNSARPSRINIGFAATLNRQLLLYFPFQLFPKNGLYTIYGEAGWYRYNYYFFGTGNNQLPDYSERYAVDYPRLRVNALRRVAPGVYAGFRWWFENWKLSEFEPQQQLASGTVSGSPGGIVTGPGIVVNFDTRNSVFYPEKGMLVEAAVQNFNSAFGSQYNYTRFLVDAAFYTKPIPSAVIAVNGIADFNQGQPPFYLMALMGGTKRMRGFYEGRFRDNNLVLLQTEWRQQIWKRFGAVAFGGAGIVADKVDYLALQHTRFTYGLGLRFTLDKKEHINVRLDYGRGTYNSSGFYLTIGEAF